MNKTRQKIHDVIYEADTPAGKIFDITLIILIIISVILVAFETVGWMNDKYSNFFNTAEWIITILFTIVTTHGVSHFPGVLEGLGSSGRLVGIISTYPGTYKCPWSRVLAKNPPGGNFVYRVRYRNS